MFDDLDLEQLRRRPGAKWSRAGRDVLPAWLADMDFPVPLPVREVLLRGVELGYPVWDDRPDLDPLREAFTDRMARRHGVTLDPGRVRLFTELNQAVQVVLHVLTRPGDGVAVHTPTYPPFLETLRSMSRRLVPVPLVDTGSTWEFDADRFAADVAASGCRVLLLVNPHNPTGRVLTRAELTAVAEVAYRHDLVVIADEVHAELVYEPHEHIPFATLYPRAVTLFSASKSFNLAGLRCAVAHVGDPRVGEALDAQPPFLFGEVNSLGVLGTLAAWQQGDEWLARARATLARNRALVAESLPPGIDHHLPEATYLAWLDCRPLDLGADPTTFFADEAGVLLSPGPDFGADGHARLNFATSGPVLTEILRRMREAVARRSG